MSQRTGERGAACRLIALVLALGGVLAGRPAQADTPTVAESAAARLHETAKDMYGQGKLAEAQELWRQALALSPQWKYAFNLAIAAPRAPSPAPRRPDDCGPAPRADR